MHNSRCRPRTKLFANPWLEESWRDRERRGGGERGKRGLRTSRDGREGKERKERSKGESSGDREARRVEENSREEESGGGGEG